MTQNSFGSIGVFLSLREMQILRQSKLTGIYRNNQSQTNSYLSAAVIIEFQIFVFGHFWIVDFDVVDLVREEEEAVVVVVVNQIGRN